MLSFTIITGLNDKDTKQQEITTEQAEKTISEIILKYADGATLTRCNGIYKHIDGAIIIEQSIKVEIAGISTEKALKIAGRIKSALNQESIYFSKTSEEINFI